MALSVARPAVDVDGGVAAVVAVAAAGVIALCVA